MEITKTVEEIKEIVQKQKITQTELANRMDECEENVSRWFHAGRTPNIRKVEKMVDALGYEIKLVKKR